MIGHTVCSLPWRGGSMPTQNQRKSSFPFNLSLKSSVLILLFAGLNSASGSLSEKDYVAALKMAEAKVQRQKAAAANPGAISSSLLRTLYGRYYRVGDTWEVAAFQYDNPNMRMTANPEQLTIKKGRGGIFRYEVTELKNGPQPSITIQVTQISDRGLKPVDPRVEKLMLTMTDSTVQTHKVYHFKGRPDPVPVSPDGLHSGIAILELFPLDVPEVITANRREALNMPDLPEGLRQIASQMGFKPDLSRSQWFEQDDFFGRPVQVLWQQGDPWPAFMKTSNGAEILIRKGAS